MQRKLTQHHLAAQLELLHHLLGDHTRSVKKLHLISWLQKDINW